jgi:hypothetical protein
MRQVLALQWRGWERGGSDAPGACNGSDTHFQNIHMAQHQ